MERPSQESSCASWGVDSMSLQYSKRNEALEPQKAESSRRWKRTKVTPEEQFPMDHHLSFLCDVFRPHDRPAGELPMTTTTARSHAKIRNGCLPHDLEPMWKARSSDPISVSRSSWSSQACSPFSHPSPALRPPHSSSQSNQSTRPRRPRQPELLYLV